MPTNETLENRISPFEGGRDAVVTGLGMAAINDALPAICRTGDEIVFGNSLFLSTYLLFNHVYQKLIEAIEDIQDDFAQAREAC
jgi:O-acetylhomoserine/O-acetylserine sulfhydrylase-like pyridoxal-dependent enzyme